jgi:HTH-type transcriptional regulator / antitoxin HigA
LEYQPKPILHGRGFANETEVENEQALAIIEKLMHLSDRTPEQQELYELTIVLVEKFEQDFYQRDKPTNPLSMLLFLMEQREMSASDLVDIFGSQPAVENILNGKTQIDRSSAELLGQLFHVDSMLFN